MSDLGFLTLGALPTFWWIIFAANYSAMIAASARVKPFNTALIWQPGATRPALARFLIAMVMLNGLPLMYGIAVSYVASCLKTHTAVDLFWFTVASFVPYACWRWYAALMHCGRSWFFKNDRAACNGALKDALDELAHLPAHKHFLGGCIYLLFAAPVAWEWVKNSSN